MIEKDSGCKEVQIVEAYDGFYIFGIGVGVGKKKVRWGMRDTITLQ